SDVKKFNDDAQREASLQAVRGGGKGDVTKTHVLWKLKNRAPDHLVSPLVVDNRLWLVKGAGLCSCFETGTGKQLWYQQRFNNPGPFLASPVFGAGKIYMASDNGKISVLANEPKLQEVARNDMGEGCTATPAIADGRLFIRTRTMLYCIGAE